MIKSLLVIMCIFLFSPSIFSTEENEDISGSEIMEVIEVIGNVSQNRSVQTVSIISKDLMKKTGATNLKNAISSAPGILTLSSGKFGQTASTYIRGSNTTQVLYIIDGIKIRDISNIGGVSLATISPFLINRIEIVRGPLSNIYGSDAMGGVISIDTGLDEGLKFESSVGSFGSYQGNISWTKNFGDIHISIGSANQFYTDNIINDNFKNNGFKAGIEYGKSLKFSTGIKLFANKTDAGIPVNFQVSTPERNYKQFNYTAAIPFEFRLSDISHLKINISYNRNDYEFKDIEDIWTPYYKNISDNKEIEVKFRSEIFKNMSINTGIDFASQKIFTEDYSGITIDNFKSNYFSSFVLLNYQSGDLFLTGSLRYDKYKDVKSNISPQIGFSYLLNNRIKFRGSYSESFKAPLPIHQINPWGIANFSLEPEKGKSYEGGIEVFLKNLIAGVTYFSTDYYNLIDWATIDFSTWAGQYQNISRAEIRGIEFELSYSPLTNLNIKYSHTYLDTENIITNKPLPRRPEHTSTLFLFYTGKSFSLSGSFRYVGIRSDFDYTAYPSDIENPPFNTYNITGIIPMGNSISLFINITNLMGRDYQEFYGYPSPGRRIEAGITYKK
ncbi:MAG: TonB-dependent receptor [Acidobacteriota bacterium]